MNRFLSIATIDEASKRINGVVKDTPLQRAKRLSQFFDAKIYFKREDLQDVRSYKIRGAYNLMSSLTQEEKKKGVVCASAGNHAQGVAFSASSLNIHTTIFMPKTTPLQKINRVKHFGGKWVDVQLVGLNYDESCHAAKEYCKEKGAIFVHPFDDYIVISGQGTVGKEIFDKLGKNIDYVLCPIGGGGLISGVATYLKSKIKNIKIIGVEPTGAAGMEVSRKAGKVVSLDTVDTFVDGVAVKTVGEKTFKIVSFLVNDIIIVPEGKVCTTMIDLYQNEGIVAEPAGALAISALDSVAKEIKGKTVVCILSGGNNDILRYPEVMEKNLVYQGLKHYFLIEFAQKPGQLRQFVDKALGPTDDIVRFEYIKKSAKETGPALIGIELTKKEDFKPLCQRMEKLGIGYKLITSSDLLYRYLI
ncbi:MAG: threonine ammonia-lyase IlvA [Candidatus Levybacteria bacterium]|nr:threonine ammonia-lyase IlvA [Candidatus Levybacteria bacterium]